MHCTEKDVNTEKNKRRMLKQVLEEARNSIETNVNVHQESYFGTKQFFVKSARANFCSQITLQSVHNFNVQRTKLWEQCLIRFVIAGSTGQCITVNQDEIETF